MRMRMLRRVEMGKSLIWGLLQRMSLEHFFLLEPGVEINTTSLIHSLGIRYKIKTDTLKVFSFFKVYNKVFIDIL
jgi:hypothetical protein